MLASPSRCTYLTRGLCLCVRYQQQDRHADEGAGNLGEQKAPVGVRELHLPKAEGSFFLTIPLKQLLGVPRLVCFFCFFGGDQGKTKKERQPSPFAFFVYRLFLWGGWPQTKRDMEKNWKAGPDLPLPEHAVHRHGRGHGVGGRQKSDTSRKIWWGEGSPKHLPCRVGELWPEGSVRTLWADISQGESESKLGSRMFYPDPCKEIERRITAPMPCWD